MRKRKDEGNEDIGIRLLRNLLLRIYKMVYDIQLKWYETLILVVVGILTGLGFGVVLSALIKVRMP